MQQRTGRPRPAQVWLRVFVIGLMILATGVYAHAGDLKLSSTWRQTDIIIDGNEDDWSGRQVYIEAIKGAIGVANDSEYLYVAISTQREDLMMKILMAGFSVWMNGDGDKDREFGIRYPNLRPPKPVGEREPSGTAPRESPDLESILAILDTSTAQPMLVGIDGTIIQRLSSDGTAHAAAAMAQRHGRLIFEFSVPLAATAVHPRAIGTLLGEKFSLGLATAKLAMDDSRRKMMPEGMGDGPMGGMGGGPMGGMGGGMRPGGRGPGGEGMERAKPFELWTKVTLAQAP